MSAHMTHFTQQKGFTLLELLVVISLMALVAGVAITGYDNFQQQARYDATRYEMTQLRQALLQFRRDSGTNDFPGQGKYSCEDPDNPGNLNPDITNLPSEASGQELVWCQHPANFWMLFINPTAQDWDIDTKRGWNGPYLTNNRTYTTVDSGYLSDGTFTSASTIDDIWTIIDAYGAPYFLFDPEATSTDPARLVSLGENQEYDDDPANGKSDCTSPTGTDDYPLDLVVCLLE